MVRTFLQMVEGNQNVRERVRLVMISEGSLRQPAMAFLRSARLERQERYAGVHEVDGFICVTIHSRMVSRMKSWRPW